MLVTLRQISKQTHIAHHVRSMSATPERFIDLSEDEDNIAVVTMKKKPVNSLCPELFNQMGDSLDEVKKKKIKGVVFTSALSNIFSAGMDLKVIYQPDPKRLAEHAVACRRVISELQCSSYVTASAINGHTSAGGCMLALSTEYRAMVDGNFTIGFNDSELGIVPPQWIIEAMQHCMGPRRAELAVTSSQLFYPREAVEVGLIHDVVSSQEEAIEKCKQFIKRFDHIPPHARELTKRRIREPIIKEWIKEIETVSIEEQVKRYMDPEIQKTIGIIVESIKNRKKK